MYENNSNEIEIYFTPETPLPSYSVKPSYDKKSGSTEMDQILKPNTLQANDHDRTHGRCDSWYNLDAGTEFDISNLPALKNGPDPHDVPLRIESNQFSLDSDVDNMRLSDLKEPKRKSVKSKSRIICISICLLIVLSAGIPLGIFFGPQLITIIQNAINGTEIEGKHHIFCLTCRLSDIIIFHYYIG